MSVHYLQSPAKDDQRDGVRVFLAGGAKDTRWRRRFAELISAREAPWIVFDPINFEWHQEALERRIDWEIRHFEQADVVAAWLPAAPADDLAAQSPTTCFELGQLTVIKPELHVGIDPGHPARALLAARLAIVDSLEALAERIPTQPPPVKLRRPQRLDEERHFHFGARVRLEELFDLGVAVRTQNVRVTIDDDCPMARELRAQLSLLLSK